MQGENSSSSSPRSNVQRSGEDEFGGVTGDDLGKFVGDASFSDVTSDDSTGWMNKIDVTNFQRLTSSSSTEAPRANAKCQRSVKESSAELLRDDQGNRYFYGSMANSCGKVNSPNQRTSCFFPSHQFAVADYTNVDSKASPPKKKSRPRGSTSTPIHNESAKQFESLEQQQQISVVSSTTELSSQVPHRQYPKPVYSYSCMIALALKNSQHGRLQVAEIYCFMCENYPYFRTAPPGWKNSVRHNLSLNKCFEKIEVEAPGGQGRKCCLWTLNPQKVEKMEQEIRKYREKDPVGVREAYAKPEDMELVEQGLKGIPNKVGSYSSVGRTRTLLPDVVQQTSSESQRHQQSQSPVFTSFGGLSGLASAYQRNAGSSNSQSPLGLMRYQSTDPRQYQWAQQTRDLEETRQAAAAAAAAAWLPVQLENNQNPLAPPLADQCPLEFSPVHQSDRYVLSTPPFSTPSRQHPFHSPISQLHSDHSHRLLALQHLHKQETPIHRQHSYPLFRDSPHNQYASFSVQHKTPERPASCGYFGLAGVNDSLLVTPTSESQQQRRCAFGTSLESAFSAATVHNNSLLLQSVQQFMGLDEQPVSQQQEAIPSSLFYPIPTSPSDTPLQLTSL